MSKNEQLKKAIISGNREKVEKCFKSSFLSKAAEVNNYDEKLFTPLALAIIKNQTEIVEFLLSQGADVNKPIGLNNITTHLYEAVQGKNKKIVELLVSKGADLNKRGTDFGMTPLGLAILDRETEIARHLIIHGADVSNDDNPLITAVASGNNTIIKLLFSYGANVNKPDLNGITPLSAAWNNMRNDPRTYREIIKLLLEHGADVSFSLNPLIQSIGYREKEIFKLLLPGYKGDLNLVYPDSDYFKTPLYVAVESGDIEIVRLLIEHGANVEAEKGDYSSLIRASELGFWNIVELLISCGANVKPARDNSNSPLFNAILKDRKDIVILLLSKGADVNDGGYYNKKGDITPLQLAFEKRQIAIIELLFKYGSNITRPI